MLRLIRLESLPFLRSAACCAALVALQACSSQPPPAAPPPPAPDYTKALAPGQPALRLLTNPAERPDLKPLAAQLEDPIFIASLERSAGWYDKPSSRVYFENEINNISHDHARVSAQALLRIVQQAPSSADAISRIDKEFDIYQTVGWNGRGDMLFTGYYTPQFSASLEKTGPYQYPLYTRPEDLRSDPKTGAVFGRETASGQVVPYFTRSQIETQGILAGKEMVYLPSRMDAYTIEVNGSAKLDLTNGQTMYIGHAGTNGLTYTSIGKLLLKDGKLDKNTISMTTIRQYFKDNPGDFDKYLHQNDRFVFFQEYEKPEDWPGGALGFRVHALRSIAADKEVYPAGAMVLVKTGSANRTGPIQPILQLAFDQDKGGAIKAPGRADFYFGIGPAAETEAGRLAVEGTIYYFFLKRDVVEQWNRELRKAP